MRYHNYILVVVLALSIDSLYVRGQMCECTDETPPGSLTCEEHEARGQCIRRWMRRGGFCAQTCGFCQCLEEAEDSECSSCDDIPPDGQFTCDQQRRFGKCEESWMRPFCRKTCGRCNCSAESFGQDDVAFIGVASEGVNKPRNVAPVRTVATPLTEVLLDDDGVCSSSLFKTLADAQQFTLLVQMLKETGLNSLLQDKNISITIFAPVNEAFADLAEEFGMTLDVLMREYPDKVKELLQYHIVPRAIADSRELGETYSFDTLVPGKFLYGSSSVEIDGIGSSAAVIQDGVKICKSMVYTMDEVLLPGNSLDEIGPIVVEVPVPQDEEPECNPNNDVMKSLSKHADLSLFVKALQEAKVSTTLENEDKGYTVFAPTDEAIERTLLEAGLSYNELIRDKKRLQAILNYHVLSKDLDSESLSGGRFTTVGGDPLVIAVEGSGIEIAGIGSSATIIEVDIDDVCTASIHKIDSLLLPFEVLGEVWAVDGVEERAAKEEVKRCNSIAHVLSRNSNLRVLNSAVQAAGLKSVFADKDQAVTIFAPTDTAFYTSFLDPVTQGLPALLTDPESLLSIISYHIIDKPLLFSRLRPGTKLETQLGSKKDGELKLSVVKKRLSPTGKIIRGVNGDAAVIQKNIVACNSVIHLIDDVLLPYDMKNNTQPISKDSFYAKLVAKT